jgi:hypothetical protein
MWFFYALFLSLCEVTKENQENVSGQLVSVLRIEILVPCARSTSCNQDTAAMDAGPSHVGQHEFFLSLILSLSKHKNICKGGNVVVFIWNAINTFRIVHCKDVFVDTMSSSDS